MHCDTGANCFISTDKANYTTFTASETKFQVVTGVFATAKGYGTIVCLFPPSATFYIIKNVPYMPDNPDNTFSPGALKHFNGFKRASHEPFAQLSLVDNEGTKFRMPFTTKNNLDYVAVTVVTSKQHNLLLTVRSASAMPITGELLHQQWGHTCHQLLEATAKSGLIGGMPKTVPSLKCPCHVCHITKATRIPRQITVDLTTFSPGFMIQMDFCFAKVPSVRGFTSILSTIDAKTRNPWAFPTRSKRPPTDLLRWFVTILRRQGFAVAFIRVDEGGELARSTEFNQLCISLDIVVQATGGYASWLNGKTERLNRSIFDVVRPILYNANLPASLWCFAAIHAVFILRRRFHRITQGIPIYDFNAIKPKYRDMVIFGSSAIIYDTKAALDDPNVRGTLSTFIGYAATMKVILHWDKTTNKYGRAHHARVDQYYSHLPAGHPDIPPGFRFLRQPNVTVPPEAYVQFDLTLADTPFDPSTTRTFELPLPPSQHFLHFEISDDETFNIPYVSKMNARSPWSRVLPHGYKKNC